MFSMESNEIAHGSFGYVFPGKDKRGSVHKSVVFKSFVILNEAEEVAAVKEVRHAKLLRGHPHIAHLEIAFIDQCREQSSDRVLQRTILVYERYMMTLSEMRVACPRAFETAFVQANVVWQLLQALGRMHMAAILHRDVKPGNIWVDLDGKGQGSETIYKNS